MTAPLPHHRVLTRLGVSQIHGVGVFAIGPIAAGTLLFPNDRAALRWIGVAELAAADLTDAQRGLYDAFAVSRGDRLGCPDNFDLLTPGWYINEPRQGEQPNVMAGDDCAMIAARDIAAGEELTAAYASFSER